MNSAEELMICLSAAALDALAQRPAPPEGDRSVTRIVDSGEINPLAWTALSKSECLLLAIALHRLSRMAG